MLGLSLSNAATGMVLAASEGGEFNPFQFDQGVVFWTVVIFVVGLIPMWKFVFGPITSNLVERDKKVEDAIAAAENARREAEEQVAKTKAELETARAEARKMVEEATARAERQAQESLAAAKDEADRQLAKARQEIDAQRSRALEDIRREVVDLAVGSAGAILKRDVNDDAHRTMVDDFIKTSGGNLG